MGKYLLVVPSSALEGQDDAYNHWYDEVHLVDLLAVPGVTSGRRYDSAPTSPNPTPGAYLAVYELELDDPMTVFQEIGKRAKSGEMKMSTALDPSSPKMWLYKAR
jgi:hypothetical protein